PAVERCHDFLAAWAYRYSSQVCRTFPGTLLLEVRASFRLFGGWPALQADLLDALGTLPVERSGLDAACAESLQRMGLRRLHQVFALPRAALGKRIGA